MDKAVQPTPAGKRVHYERRRPKETTLCQLVQEYLETLLAQVELETGRDCPTLSKFDNSLTQQYFSRLRKRAFISLIRGCRAEL